MAGETTSTFSPVLKERYQKSRAPLAEHRREKLGTSHRSGILSNMLRRSRRHRSYPVRHAYTNIVNVAD